jgi:hypothetical protein
MPRTTRASRTLIRQVQKSLNRKAETEAGQRTAVPTDEPDGLGVYREYTFDKTASKGLAERLNAAQDPRIASVEEKGGQVVVTFVPSTEADDPAEFDLAAEASGEVAGDNATE